VRASGRVAEARESQGLYPVVECGRDHLAHAGPGPIKATRDGSHIGDDFANDPHANGKFENHAAREWLARSPRRQPLFVELGEGQSSIHRWRLPGEAASRAALTPRQAWRAYVVFYDARVCTSRTLRGRPVGVVPAFRQPRIDEL
jgi:hypothetical protein